MAKKRVVKKSKSIKRFEKHVKGSHIPARLAGALYVILGMISLFSGLFMTYLAYYSSGIIISSSNIIMQGNLALFLIGSGSALLGVLYFLIGFGLWRLNKWAGTLGLIMAVFSLVLSIPYISFNPFAGAADLLISLVLIVLLFRGRKELAGSDFQ